MRQYIIVKNNKYLVYDELSAAFYWTDDRYLATVYTNCNSAMVIARQYGAKVESL